MHVLMARGPGLGAEGSRVATVTATSELICYRPTWWEPRPLVTRNGTIGWKPLRSKAETLRTAQGESAPESAPPGAKAERTVPARTSPAGACSPSLTHPPRNLPNRSSGP